MDRLQRYRRLEEQYRALHETPDRCEPLVMIDIPVPNCPDCHEQLHSPQKMLEAGWKKIRLHEEIGDDTLPMVRVEFGTAQVAAAFGCELREIPGSLPACATHSLQRTEDVWTFRSPGMEDGLLPRIREYTACYRSRLPEGIAIQHPDIAGPFNSAHLIRGNDILFDFYDDPAAVRELLRRVTDYTIDFLHETKKLVPPLQGWFYDMGGLWKGAARISNCSLQIVSPAHYRALILPEDIRFFEAVGGGRMHYCGSHPEVIEDFFKIPNLYSLELDCQYHDLLEISERCPPGMVLRFCDWSVTSGNGDWLPRLLSGRVPAKKNLVISAKAENIEEAKRLYDCIKNTLVR